MIIASKMLTANVRFGTYAFRLQYLFNFPNVAAAIRKAEPEELLGGTLDWYLADTDLFAKQS
jgi:hypothetical protein